MRYRFGFNGKENDNEVKGTGNQQDYGFRIYDPRLGRFLSIDPLYQEYPELSVYQFASNNPIMNIDLDGLEGVKPEVNPQGTVLKVSNAGMISNEAVTITHIPKLEKGTMSQVSGIILHRTVSSTTNSALNSFKDRGVGTHFLVGKDGQILQTASLNQKTSHLRKSQLEEGAPRNNQAIGIEVVGNYNAETKTWDPLTEEQTKAVSFLVNSLLQTYKLKEGNIYNHEDIQPKTPGEGKVVYEAIKSNLPSNAPAPVVAPPTTATTADDLHQP